MSDKKLAIKLSTLEDIGNAVREKEQSSEPIPVNALADRIGALRIASGENKLAKVIEGSVTELTEDYFEGVTQIRDYAFFKILTLTTVIFSETIKSISNYAFQSCRELTNVILPSNLENIGSYAFSNCSKITSINFPASVKTVNNYAFQNSGLTSVVIPNTLTRLYDAVFVECKSLETAVLGSGITEIDDRTFQNCSSLREVRLSEGLTLIRYMSFSDCPSLTNLTIPASVTKIETGALQIGSTTNKATITFLRATPPTITSSTFSTSYLNKIIVPAGSGDAYRTATNWANFADYIEEATA